LLEPHFVKGLNEFQTSFKGPFGEIQSSWKREGKKVIYQVVIPANSIASLKLSGKKVSQNGKAVYTSANGANYLTQLAAGSYEFMVNQ
jgi:alpha-L-rhamnosidase